MMVRGCDFPEDRCYHPEHNVWLKSEAPGVVVLGATSFGVALAVEFVAYIPKPVGTEVDAGRAVGLLELVKTIVSVRTPVAGTILEHNAAAVADPAVISADPYGAGWLVRLKVDAGPTALQPLVSGQAIGPAFEEAMRLESYVG
jgi:glycine cleavage system H protein